MPDTTNSIQSGGGGDYTTIQTHEDDTDVSGGFWKGEIDDTSNYDETVTVSGGTGTPTISAYYWLEASSGNRHAGAAGTGHARVDNTGGDTAAFQISSDFVRIGFLEIKRSSGTGLSDEGARLNSGVNDFLGESLIIWTAETDGDTDGIYAGNWDVDFALVNCILQGWRRACIHLQQFNAGTARTITAAIDYCSIYDGGVAGETESGAINVRTEHADDSITLSMRNSAFMDTQSTFDDWSITSALATAVEEANVIYICDSNITSDASQTARDVDGDDVINNKLESKTSSNVWTDAANGDFTVVSSGDADNAGISLVGSEADSRADYSVDIAGTSRSGSSPDIGAFEGGTAPGGTTPKGPLGHPLHGPFGGPV